MKQVVKKLPPVTQFVAADKVNADKYYGVKTTANAPRSFVSRTQYNIGRYEVRLMEGVTNANSYGYYGDTIKELMTKLLQGNCDVYEFNTGAELFKWLAE